MLSATKFRVDPNVSSLRFLCSLLILTETLVVSLASICSFSLMRYHLNLGEVKPEVVSEDTVKAVAETLRKSSFLKVSEDGQKIGRTMELVKPEKVIEQVVVRTITASQLAYEVQLEEMEPFFDRSAKMDSPYDSSSSNLLMSNDMYDEAGDPILSQNPNEASHAMRKSQRTKNFSRKEDILLVSAWLNTSKDAVTRSVHQSSSLWGRIYDYFVNDAGTQVGRSQTSLINRWGVINTNCAKFTGYLSQIESTQQIGQTEQERLVNARDLYASSVGKQFQFEHCWQILKFEHKWTDTLSTKKQKNGLDASPASSSPATPQSAYLGNDIEASANLNRKLCINASKKQPKNKNNKDEAQDLISDKHWQEKVELERAKAERHERELALHQRKLDLEEKRMELQVMQTDTSGMDSVSAKYWQNLKLEIMEKRGFNK